MIRRHTSSGARILRNPPTDVNPDFASLLCLQPVRIDIAALTFRVEETGIGEPLELPLTRQLAAALKRRRAAATGMPEAPAPLAFASETRASSRIYNLQHLYAPIMLAGRAGFWRHANGQPGWPVEQASIPIYANRRDYQSGPESTGRPNQKCCPRAPPVTACSSSLLSLLSGGRTRCAVVPLSS